ncbi:MAG: chemotaxis-specific protein-glutamate methyltransferase CheB [Deltaproteobacteria bacterium]|nr:chemotaxis-specific protein-glutamate methyltransferase CheB [Deltaproteobacteria bacterium]
MSSSGKNRLTGLPRPRSAGAASISVLIVDDSGLVRRALRSMLESDPSIRVVGEAANGREAIERATRLRPTIVTMDLEMPDMNGLEAIEQIMSVAPTRILVVTGLPRYAGLDATFESISRGALELVPKPSAPSSGEELVRHVRALADVPVMPRFRVRAKERRARLRSGLVSVSPKVVVMGASTGGPSSLTRVFEHFAGPLRVPIVVVQHISKEFAASFVDWLATRTALPVTEARPGVLHNGIHVGVRGAHVRVRSDGSAVRADFSPEPPRGGHMPSIDVLFESAADSFGAAAIGVLLTGMGNDGASGLLRIRTAEGMTIAQDEHSSVVYGMPRVAVELGAVRLEAQPSEIGAELTRLVGASA